MRDHEVGQIRVCPRSEGESSLPQHRVCLAVTEQTNRGKVLRATAVHQDEIAVGSDKSDTQPSANIEDGHLKRHFALPLSRGLGW